MGHTKRGWPICLCGGGGVEPALMGGEICRKATRERHRRGGGVLGLHGAHVEGYGRPTYLKSQTWIS